MARKKMSASQLPRGKKESDRVGEARHARGGELHQTAGGQHPALTTNQGVALSDNQNSLKANPRGLCFSKTLSCARRSRILITSASFTHELQVCMDISSSPLRSRNTVPPEYSPR